MPPEADVALSSDPEPKGDGGGLVRGGPVAHPSLHTNLEHSMTI